VRASAAGREGPQNHIWCCCIGSSVCGVTPAVHERPAKLAGRFSMPTPSAHCATHSLLSPDCGCIVLFRPRPEMAVTIGWPYTAYTNRWAFCRRCKVCMELLE
jgi:hypothetical protein